MKIKDIPIEDGKKQFDVIDKGDVVMLPAFGAAVDEMLVLSDKNVQIVDTTCPWVSKVLFSESNLCSYSLFLQFIRFVSCIPFDEILIMSYKGMEYC